MGRIKQANIEGEPLEEEPMVFKRVKKEENGIVPVLTDDIRVYYDSHDHVYFAVIKVEGKKIRLEMSKE